MSKYRTHTCGELTLNNKDQTIKLSGWINKKRDHGNLLFLDLRDHYGLTQCVIDEGKKIFKENKVKIICQNGSPLYDPPFTLRLFFLFKTFFNFYFLSPLFFFLFSKYLLPNSSLPTNLPFKKV